jgi:two-component system nitrogen regulation sensor histidine kinase NtrY
MHSGSAAVHCIDVWKNIKFSEMRFERQILIRSLASGIVGSLIALWFLWTSNYSVQTQVIVTVFIVLSWLGFAFGLKEKIAYPLRTLSNIMEALREGDYSMRIRGAFREDALGELIWEVNALTRSLQDRRFGAMETTALLRKILAQIDVAMFGFDREGKLCLINDSGQQLFDTDEAELLGTLAANMGLSECLDGTTPRVVDLALPGGVRRWELRRTTYREKGVSHQLIFLSDLTRTLHEEERLAWKRLVQIMRHEINNSLTPIQSVAQTLQTRIKQDVTPEQWRKDVEEGLEIIGERSEELSRFIAAYTKLTRLPEPLFDNMHVHAWIQHVAGLETRVTITIHPGPAVTIQADRGQLDQLLINLLANAVEASLETHADADGQVILGWRADKKSLQVWIDDDGPGLVKDRDVFVPFFTTKEQGSGIGLALSRQIAEAHGGYLTLENRPKGKGCRASLWLPIERSAG